MAKQAYMGSQVAFRRPACVIMLGAIAVEWSLVEALLSSQFAAMIFNGRNWSDGGEAITQEAFEQSRSVRQKRALLMIASRRRFARDLVDRYDTMLNDVQDAGEKRGKVLHGYWGLNDSEPQKMIWRQSIWKFEESVLYGPDELKAILDEITRASSALNELFFKEMRPLLVAASEAQVKNLLAFEEMKKGG